MGTDPAIFTRFQVWFSLSMRTAGAALLAWAAVGGDRRHRWRHPGPVVVGAALAGGGLIAAAIGATVRSLPEPLRRLEQVERPEVEGPPAMMAAQLVLMVIWSVAAAGFARRHAIDRVPVHLALAVGAALAAFSRTNFLLHPSLYTDVVHVGDLFRLAFYLVLTVSATGTVVGYWRAEAASAAVVERERLASELHDGLSQELAFLRSRLTSLLAGREQPDVLPHLVQAADRALAESRRIVRVLDPATADPPELVLDRAAREVADRAGVEVELLVDPATSVPHDVLHDLARIVREAANNAVRHGSPNRIRLNLGGHGAGVVVRVSDDGCGFDPAVARDGYGLRSMQRRAASMGAELQVRSTPGAGTVVEVGIP